VDAADPLIATATLAYLGVASNPAGKVFRDARGARDGILTKMPTWRQTQWGPGVQTDLQKYVDLSASLRPGSPFTIAVAYLYRYDASTSGSDTETGILFSAGQGGLSFRHGNGTLEFLKSRIASIVSGSAPANRDEMHTAVLSATYAFAGTANFTLFYDGNKIATGSSNNGVGGQGTTTTALGMDFGATTMEYGRHTILACLVYDTRWGQPTWTQNHAREFHEAARKSFSPFLIRPIAFGDGTYHVPTELTGATTQGFGLGSTPNPEPWIRQGIGLGVATDPEPYIRQGFALGATMRPVDLFGLTITRMLFGSSPDVDKQVSKGFGLGAKFTLDAQYASAAAGLALGSKPTSDSGDLANNRYRR
jgi:hypothetical protein